MILNFNIKAAVTENRIIPQRNFLCAVIVASFERTGDFAGKTARKRNQALMMLFEKLSVDSRLRVKAVNP